MGCRLLDQVAGKVVDAAGGRPLTVDPQDEIVQPLCVRLVAQTLWVARWRGIWHTGTQLWNAMPCRIGVPDSVVQRIRVPVQRLRIARVRHDGVGLRETANLRSLNPRSGKATPLLRLAICSRLHCRLHSSESDGPPIADSQDPCPLFQESRVHLMYIQRYMNELGDKDPGLLIR